LIFIPHISRPVAFLSLINRANSQYLIVILNPMNAILPNQSFLSERQKQLVKESWTIVAQDLAGNGSCVFKR
jgi:hypothetical protein